MIEQVTEQLRHLISTTLDLNIPLNDITADAPLFEEGLGLDSIAIVELITLVEEQFKFEFDEDHLNFDAFHDVKTLAAFIVSQTETSAALSK